MYAAAAPTPAMKPLFWVCATSAAPPVVAEEVAPGEVAVALSAAVEELAVLLDPVAVASAPDAVEVPSEEVLPVGAVAVPVAEPEGQETDCGKSCTPTPPQICWAALTVATSR